MRLANDDWHAPCYIVWECNRGGNDDQGTWILSSGLGDQITVLPAFTDWSTQNAID
jgi:hypothetical protein